MCQADRLTNAVARVFRPGSLDSTRYKILWEIKMNTLEPVTAIRHPPAKGAQGNRRPQRPPKRQRQIGHQSQHGKRGPKHLPLHSTIVDRMRVGWTRVRQNSNIPHAYRGKFTSRAFIFAESIPNT